MLQTLLDEIIEAEKNAAEIIKNAESDAAATVFDAKIKNEKKLDADKKAKEDAHKKALIAAENTAKSNYDKAIKLAAEKVTLIEKSSKKNMSGVVDKIVKAII